MKLPKRSMPWVILDWAMPPSSSGPDARAELAALLDSALAMSTTDRTIVVLREQDRPCWAPVLAEFQGVRVLEQPFDRGSAVGVLVAALSVERSDPAAVVHLLGRAHGSMTLRRLLRHYERTAPYLLASASRILRNTYPGQVTLDQLYPFLSALEFESVVNP